MCSSKFRQGKFNLCLNIRFVQTTTASFPKLFTVLDLILVFLFLNSFVAINEWLAPLSSSVVRFLPSILIVMTGVHCQSLNLFFEFKLAATLFLLGILCLRVIFLIFSFLHLNFICY